ncbi:MAG TPA: MMPL family transporter [Solirubrobacteraceae bacterium]|nr:MMPL family transporter [Solirubrobacteraceae bacterium]
MQPRSSARRASTPALGRVALRHPWPVLSAWLAIVAVLGIVGLGIEGRLSPSALQVSDSESGRARALIGGSFGDSATVPVLLRGPRAAVKTQGKEIARRLARRPGVRVLSPWSASSRRSALRPSGERALLLLSVAGSREQIARRSAAAQRLVAARTSAPVRATVTGLPLLSSEGTRLSLSAIRRAELIALPLLFVALLLVFRSLAAAAIPAAFGAATIASSTGLLSLLAGVVQLDAFALAISCMVGLALAVDYSLLLVSRMREEAGERPDADVRAAIGRSVAPTTRTVAVAAAAIVVAMAVAATLSAGTGLLAAAVGVSVVAVVSAATAMLVVPAILVVAGGSLRRRAPASAAADGTSAKVARAAMRRPLLGLVAVALLLAACVPVLGLRSGAPTPDSLPSDSPARADHDVLADAMGAGWTQPFEIVAVTHRGPVTTQPRLAELARVQRRLARDPAVRAVLGPGAIARSAAQLRRSGRTALAAGRATPREGGRLRKLDEGVSSAADGAGSLRSALSGATSAAGRAAAGSRRLEGGVGELKSGLDGAGSGAHRLAGKLSDARSGAGDLASRSGAVGDGARRLRDGARSLRDGLSRLAGGAHYLEGRLQVRAGSLERAQAGVRAQRRQADDALAAAERSIAPTTAAGLRARSALARARRALAGDAAAALDEPLRQIALDAQYAGRIASATPTNEAARLATAVGGLTESAQAITRSVRELGGTVGALTQGNDELARMLGRLDAGAGRITSALGAVRTEADGFATGARAGEQRAGRLASGLDDARSAVRGLSRSGGGAAAPRSARASFFDSGYFLLAALESGGGKPIGVNIDRGGQGARIVVVPRYKASDPRTQALYRRLRTATAQLGASLGAQAAVGGPAALLADYNSVAGDRLPLIVIVLTLATALLLGVLLRSIVVPIVGVVVNLLAVGATLGLLALLFQGDAPLLGGPGTIDALAVTAIFGVVFALSIDYQVFILTRVREEWLRCGDEERALRVGLSRTARVVTGAALSMLGVFVAFGLADVASVRQFGVGLAIAVIIDATLVRLVLMPAALLVAGEWTWLRSRRDDEADGVRAYPPMPAVAAGE